MEVVYQISYLQNNEHIAHLTKLIYFFLYIHYHTCNYTMLDLCMAMVLVVTTLCASTELPYMRKVSTETGDHLW